MDVGNDRNLFKIISAVACIALLIVCIILGVTVSNSKKQLNEVTGKAARANEETATVQKQVEELQGKVKELESSVAEYKEKSESTSSELKTVNAELEETKSKLTKVEDEYKEYKTRMQPYEELEEIEAKEKVKAAKAAEEDKKNIKTATEAVNKIWDDKTGLIDGATQSQIDTAAEKVAAINDKTTKKALKAKVDAANEALAAEKAAKAAEEAAGYDTGITYDQLARTPDDFEGKKVKFTGEVLQVMEETSTTTIRLAVNDDYSKVIMGSFSNDLISSRILEDDHITVYGTSLGIYTYESTWGKSVSVPYILIAKIDQ